MGRHYLLHLVAYFSGLLLLNCSPALAEEGLCEARGTVIHQPTEDREPWTSVHTDMVPCDNDTDTSMVFTVELNGYTAVCEVSSSGDDQPDVHCVLYQQQNTTDSTIHMMETTVVPEIPTTEEPYEPRFNLQGCDGNVTLVATSGFIMSPGYPYSDYSSNMDCYWQIQAPPRQVFQIVVDFVDLEESPDCVNDGVELYGITQDTQTRSTVYCGQIAAAAKTVYAQLLLIHFYTNENVQSLGFKLLYNTINSSQDNTRSLSIDACAALGPRTLVLSNSSSRVQKLSSPGYVGDLGLPAFQSNQDCQWIVMAPSGYIIEAVFDVMELEASPTCCRDYVELWDGDQPGTSLLGTYCGSSREQDRVLTTSHCLYVKFVSDHRGNDGGFVLEFSLIEANDTDDTEEPTEEPDHRDMVELYETEGEVMSPDYPSMYPHSTDRQWTITVPQGMVIVLNVSVFELEESRDCEYDSLTVYDVYDDDMSASSNTSYSRQLAVLCGHFSPFTIYSAFNTVRLELHTDDSLAYRGFYAEYKALNLTNDACFDSDYVEVGSLVGAVSSPNFPMNYATNLSCFWRMESYQQSKLQLWIDGLSLADANDGFIFHNNFDQGSSSVTNSSYGVTWENVVQFEGTQYAGAILYTDDTGNAAGFYLTYVSVPTHFTVDVCDETIVVGQGDQITITSPHFPLSYIGPQNCTLEITGTSVLNMTVTFEQFELEYTTNCMADYLQFIDVGSSLDIGMYCGDTIPDTIQVATSQLEIIFIADAYDYHSGFAMNIAVTEPS